jgi:hypothetical protein
VEKVVPYEILGCRLFQGYSPPSFLLSSPPFMSLAGLTKGPDHHVNTSHCQLIVKSISSSRAGGEFKRDDGV